MSCGPLQRGLVLLTAEYTPFPGGIATYADRLAHEARATGANVQVFAPDYPELPQAPDETVHRLWRHHRIALMAAMKAAWLIMTRYRGHILLAADIRTVLVAYLLKLATGRRYRAAIHGSEVTKFGPGSPLKGLVRAAYTSAEMVSANSKASLDAFEGSFGSCPQGVVNHLGVDERWFENPECGFDHPALAVLPANAAIVVTVGRIEDRKGQREAVRIVDAARRIHGAEHLVYVVAGRVEDGGYYSEVRDLAETLGVQTVFLGRVSDADLARLYYRSVCHLLCALPLPTKIEGFGLVLLEAAAQGCPSVTTRVGGIPEVVEGAGSDIFEPDDLDGMAKAVASYALNPALRDVAGRAARDNARRFSWRRCAIGTFPELYEAKSPGV